MGHMSIATVCKWFQHACDVLSLNGLHCRCSTKWAQARINSRPEERCALKKYIFLFFLFLFAGSSFAAAPPTCDILMQGTSVRCMNAKFTCDAMEVTTKFPGEKSNFYCQLVASATPTVSSGLIPSYTMSAGRTFYSNSIVQAPAADSPDKLYSLPTITSGPWNGYSIGSSFVPWYACAGWVENQTNGKAYYADPGSVSCIPVEPDTLSCSATDTVIDHGSLTPGTYDGHEATGKTTISCDGDATVTLSLSSNEVQLNNGTTSTLSFGDAKETTSSVAIVGNTSTQVDIHSILEGTPAVGDFTGSTTLIVTAQ